MGEGREIGGVFFVQKGRGRRRGVRLNVSFNEGTEEKKNKTEVCICRWK